MLRSSFMLPLSVVMLLAAAFTICAADPEADSPVVPTDSSAEKVVAEPVPDDASSSPAESVPSQEAKESPSAKLPWEEKNGVAKESTLIPVSGAREVLERYNLTESELFKFFNGQPLGPNEEGVLLKILYHLPGLGLEWIEGWRKKDLPLDALVLDTKKHQLDVIPLTGRVKRVSKKAVTPEIVDQYEFDHYYVVKMVIDNSAYAAEIYTRIVPERWPLDKELDEPAKADGLFLKVGGGDQQEAPLIFAAGRVRWYPDKVSPAFEVREDQIRLAKLGVDWGQFEAVKKTNRKGFVEEDRESFYQLLAGIRSEEGQKQSSLPHTRLKLDVLLNDPQAAQGEWLPLKGFVRRITKVLVEDRDIQVRYKIDHYYQLDCFLPLGQTRLRLGETPEDSVEFNNDFPATLCALELPEHLSPGENMREEISIDAVFFKTWSYESEFAARKNVLQPAPMFVGFRPTLIVPEKTTGRPGDLIIGLAVAATCMVGLVIFWWHSQKQGGAVSAFPATNSNDPPDFSGLK